METTNNIQSVAERNITMVALASIQPSSYNPRKNFDEASLAELAESIRQQGVLQPIGVRPIADDRMEIVFGERRCRASLMAGLKKIPAVERLPKAHRERSPRCAVVGGAVRKERELHPHPSEIRLIDTRNRPTSGAGRNHNQRGKRNLPLWRGYSERGVREAPQRRCEV